jgi:hypothetical protein
MIPRARAAFAANPLAWSLALVLLAALASSVTGLGNGFAYDDIPIIVENPMVGSLHSPWAYLTDSYWGPSRGNSLYRPLTIALFSLQWAVGDGSPFPFHLMNVLLYAGTSVAVLMLFRRLLPAAAALLGALVFAVHPVHVEAVANVVGQSEMLAGIPMLAALALYARARRDGVMSTRTTVAILACYALALASKEHGITLPALLALMEFVPRGAAPGESTAIPRPRAPLPWPLWRSIVVMTVAYLVVRTSILEGLAGDAAHPAMETLSRGERAWTMLALVPEFVRLLWWPVRLYADYSPQAVPLETTPALAHLPGAALLLLFGALTVWAWRRERLAFVALSWLPVSLALVANILVPTGVMLAERTLFLPVVGIALLISIAAERLSPVLVARTGAPVRLLVAGGVVAVLLAGIARSAERQLVWEDNASVFSTTVVDAPNNYRAHHALGEVFGGAGAWSRAEEHLRIADSIFPGYDLLELSLARVLHFDDRCPAALEWYDRVLAKRPDAEIALIGRTACLLEMRRLSDARAESVDGIARGISPGPFGLLLQKAESSLAAWDTVDARNRWYRAGAPVSRSTARLKVPVLMMRRGGVPVAGRMPDSTPKPP